MGAMATEFATTKEACDEAQVPQVWRDACAHLLIPLNACRKKEFYLPWKYVNKTTLMLVLMLSAAQGAHLLEVWGGRNAPHTPHTSHRERADTEILLHLYYTPSYSWTKPNQPSRLYKRCEHERHVYELCQYKDYKKRVKAAEDAK